MPSSFADFASQVWTALASPRYCRRILPAVITNSVTHEAFLTLECTHADYLILSICALNRITSETRIWSLRLTEDALTAHMEEDLGIYDRDGIRNFGTRFAAALKKDIYLDLSSVLEQPEPDGQVGSLSLHVVYDIADLRADTVLLIPLLQAKLREEIFHLMLPIQLLPPSAVGGTAGVVSANSLSKFSELLPAQQGMPPGDVSTTEGADGDAYVSQPDAAKRRKGGGVKLSASRRR